MHCHAGLLGALIALGTLGLAAPSALATTTTIYKCLDRHLSVVYTDSPCKEGERMDIDAGDANPVAVSKLEHFRDMLDRAAAERIADERHAALERDLAAMTRRQPEEERGASDYAAPLASYDPVYSLYPTLRQRSMRPRMVRHAGLRRFTPNPPYHVRSSSAHSSPRL
jgi:hypothetical protein